MADRARFSILVVLLLGCGATAVRGQEITGPESIDPHTLGSYELAWKGPPGRSDWAVIPAEGFSYAKSASGLVLTGKPGLRTSVVAFAILPDGSPSILIRSVVIEADDDDGDGTPPDGPPPKPVGTMREIVDRALAATPVDWRPRVLDALAVELMFAEGLPTLDLGTVVGMVTGRTIVRIGEAGNALAGQIADLSGSLYAAEDGTSVAVRLASLRAIVEARRARGQGAQ